MCGKKYCVESKDSFYTESSIKMVVKHPSYHWNIDIIINTMQWCTANRILKQVKGSFNDLLIKSIGSLKVAPARIELASKV